MDIQACILKIYPDWKGAVWGNSYEGIKPDASESRPIPKLSELEAVWPAVSDELQQKAEVEAQEALIQAEMARLLREQAIANLKAAGKIQ